MLDLDHWREIRDALAANKTRTALTAFGVFWAIFMLLIMLGAGNGLRNGAGQMFAGTATNSFFVWTQRTSKPHAGLPSGRSFEFDVSDVEWLKRNVPEGLVGFPTQFINEHTKEVAAMWTFVNLAEAWFFMQHYTGSGFADHVYSANICDDSDRIQAQIANVAEVIDAVCADASG